MFYGVKIRNTALLERVFAIGVMQQNRELLISCNHELDNNKRKILFKGCIYYKSIIQK